MDRYRLTDHAVQQMARRGITKETVEQVMAKPDQIAEAYGAKLAYQSRISFRKGKMYLVRVIVDPGRKPPEIVTVYRTARVSRYWKEGT